MSVEAGGAVLSISLALLGGMMPEQEATSNGRVGVMSASQLGVARSRCKASSSSQTLHGKNTHMSSLLFSPSPPRSRSLAYSPSLTHSSSLSLFYVLSVHSLSLSLSCALFFFSLSFYLSLSSLSLSL